MPLTTASDFSTQISSRFLEGLSTPDRTAILRAGTVMRLPAQCVITEQSTSADQVYLLIKGSARYFFLTQSGHKLLLRWFLPGEIFGACALLPDSYPYLVSAETVKASVAVMWERETIRKMAARFPQLWENALAIASEYLTLYVSAHVALAYRTAHERLAEVLLNLASVIGRPAHQGLELEVSNEELANSANVTLFTASRFIANWERSGAIAKSRGKILLRYPERLLPRPNMASRAPLGARLLKRKD